MTRRSISTLRDAMIEADTPFLVKSQLFAQKENFCGKHGAGVQTKPEEAHAIDEKRQQRANELPAVAEQVWG